VCKPFSFGAKHGFLSDMDEVVDGRTPTWSAGTKNHLLNIAVLLA
jgi:hypothetical protein